MIPQSETVIDSPRAHAAPQSPTYAGSDSKLVTEAAVRARAQAGLISMAYPVATTGKPLAERLFDSQANFKVAASVYMTHFDRDWRDKLFRQIDALLDIDEWHPNDIPLGPHSYKTFLRFMTDVRPRRPGLGATPDGNLIASWSVASNFLTVSFQPNDQTRWVVNIASDDSGRETAAGLTNVRRLMNRLAPYGPAQWFHEERSDP